VRRGVRPEPRRGADRERIQSPAGAMHACKADGDGGFPVPGLVRADPEGFGSPIRAGFRRVCPETRTI
jgi:hypothetical protein